MRSFSTSLKTACIAAALFAWGTPAGASTSPSFATSSTQSEDDECYGQQTGEPDTNYEDYKTITDEEIFGVVSDALHAFSIEYRYSGSVGGHTRTSMANAALVAEGVHDYEWIASTGAALSGLGAGVALAPFNAALGVCRLTNTQKLLAAAYRSTIKSFFGDGTLSDAVADEMANAFTKYLTKQFIYRTGVDERMVDAGKAIANKSWKELEKLLLTNDVRMFSKTIENANPTYPGASNHGKFELQVTYAYSATDGKIIGTIRSPRLYKGRAIWFNLQVESTWWWWNYVPGESSFFLVAESDMPEDSSATAGDHSERSDTTAEIGNADG